MKKILLITVGLILSNSIVMADSGYVSPETYAINEGDLQQVYQQIMQSPGTSQKSSKRVNKQVQIQDSDSNRDNNEQNVNYSENTDSATTVEKYDPSTDTEKGLRATLRRLRYKTLNPYHGEKHQIKVEASKSFEQK